MDLTKLKALIDLVSSSRITELEMVEGEETVRITKPAPAFESPAAVPSSIAPAASPPAEAPIHAPEPQDDLVRAPMYGVFHRTPAPEAAPFVELGQQVQQGQTLCLIEAMKTFNAVTAERAGTLAAILVEGGQEVEQGQPLFRIEWPCSTRC